MPIVDLCRMFQLRCKQVARRPAEFAMDYAESVASQTETSGYWLGKQSEILWLEAQTLENAIHIPSNIYQHH